MIARDVMTSPVVTVGPEAKVAEIAKVLMERRISAVPVVDDAGRLAGIVSEGDLLGRVEKESKAPRSWWLSLLSDPVTEAQRYVKEHGQFAREVMTRQVVSVAEDASLTEIATILEERGIKRVPVVREDKVVGIVSRANLLQGLAVIELPAARSGDDQALRDAIDREIGEAGIRTTFLNIVVAGGVAHLWGAIESLDELNALNVILENTPGIERVERHLTVFEHPTLAY